MNRSSTPQDGPGDFARHNSHVNPAEVAEALLRKFHDIQSLTNPDHVIAYLHTTSAAWEQCAIGSRRISVSEAGIERLKRHFATPELERQAKHLENLGQSCVARMVSLCLEKTGSERRLLHKKFRLALSAGGWSVINQYTLKRVPLWFYKGSWG